jgi:hypothetical protein
MKASVSCIQEFPLVDPQASRSDIISSTALVSTSYCPIISVIRDTSTYSFCCFLQSHSAAFIHESCTQRSDQNELPLSLANATYLTVVTNADTNTFCSVVYTKHSAPIHFVTLVYTFFCASHLINVLNFLAPCACLKICYMLHRPQWM